MRCTSSFPELEPRSVEERNLAWESWPTDGSGAMPFWKRKGSSGEDQASTHASDGESSIDDFGCSPSPRCCWAPSSLVGSTPSPQLVVVSAWAGSAANSSTGSVRPKRSAPRNARSMPFQALDLPEWARMTEKELDELSDSDYDGDSEDEFADESSDEFADDCADESADEFVDEFADKALTEDFAENMDSGAEVEVLRRCSSPSNSGVSDPHAASLSDVSTTLPKRWADLADSEDEELAQASCVANGPRTASGPRWADLVDEEEDFSQYPAAEPSLQAVCWADLVDSNSDSQ